MSKGDNRRPNDPEKFDAGYDRTFNRNAEGETRQDIRGCIRVLASRRAHARAERRAWGAKCLLLTRRITKRRGRLEEG